jgi:hypothetical protein
MKSMKKVLLGTALAVGAFAMTAAPAHAAHIGVYVGVGGPAAYIPPSPGPGYSWVGGYWSNGYFVPGYWNYVGGGYYRGPVVRYDRDGYRDRDDFYHDRDRDWDRDRDRDRDRDNFRR